MTRKQRAAVYTIVPAILFITTYIIYRSQTAVSSEDIYTHMNLSLSLSRLLDVSHCGWHFLCWLLYALLPLTIEQGAAAATAVFNALTAVVVLWICERLFAPEVRDGSGLDSRLSPNAGRAPFSRRKAGNMSGTNGAAGSASAGAGWLLTSFAALCSLYVGPLYMRFYNPKYYLGQGTPNVWHNPTTVAARTTMLLVGVLTIDYWNADPERRVWKAEAEDERQFLRGGIPAGIAYQLGIGLLLFISTLAKPSYLMAYAPAVFLFLVARLMKGKGRNFFRIILDNLYFVPSLLLFLSQYIRIYIFGGALNKKSGVVISWFTSAGRYAPNIGISLVLRMAFPFLMILLWWKFIYKDRLFQLLFTQYIIALVTSWAFAESGARAKSGNFGWGNMMCSSFLWIWCVMFFLREWKAEGWSLKGKSITVQLRYIVPALLLGWHLLAGILSLSIYYK